MTKTEGSPVPYDCSVQLGGGYGTACYREWGYVAEGLLGKGFSGSRRALNVWARSHHDMWFLRNPDEDNCAVFEIHSATGFQRNTIGSEDEAVYDVLLFRITLSWQGEIHGYEVVPGRKRS